MIKAKVDKLIANQSVHLQDNDAADISHNYILIVMEVSPIVEGTFPLNSPQRIFWDQQKHYNSTKDKRQMRWHPLVIRFALNLKYLSGTAYRAVCQSGLINLPPEHTLSDYTHWVTVLASRRSTLWSVSSCLPEWTDQSPFRAYAIRLHPLGDTTQWRTAEIHRAIPVLASGRSSLWPVCPFHGQDEAQIRTCLQQTHQCSLGVC